MDQTKLTIKTKHNKRRNTLFLYEVLVKEVASCILKKDEIRKTIAVAIIKEHFSRNSILKKEMDLFRGVLEINSLNRKVAEKILEETKRQYALLNKQEIFKNQTKLINDVNKKLNPTVFSNFVSSYKNLATIYQIFNNSVTVKDKVILEEMTIRNMCQKQSIVKEEEMKPLDNIVFQTFVNKFNQKYGGSLLKEQKDLLTNYITSFADDGLNFKYFLNEELDRVKKTLNECIENKTLQKEEDLKKMSEKIFEKLESFRYKDFDQDMISQLLKIQQFVNEASKD